LADHRHGIDRHGVIFLDRGGGGQDESIDWPEFKRVWDSGVSWLDFQRSSIHVTICSKPGEKSAPPSATGSCHRVIGQSLKKTALEKRSRELCESKRLLKFYPQELTVGELELEYQKNLRKLPFAPQCTENVTDLSIRRQDLITPANRNARH